MCILCELGIVDALMQPRYDQVASEKFGQGGFSIAVLNAQLDELTENNSPSDPVAYKCSLDIEAVLVVLGNAFPNT